MSDNGAAVDDAGADLVLEHVTKRFTTFTAVDDLSLAVPQGSFFALLGPSGCGKTTTLRMVAGLETPSSGSIFIDGKDVTDAKPYNRPVNTVFQSYALFPHLSVVENVAFGLRRKKVPGAREKALQFLELVELAHLAERRPAQLSGGQQQRVACARALVSKPAVVLADEPTGNLDSRSGAEVLSFLRRSVRELGRTVIMVTHDPTAAAYADRVVLIADGRIAGTIDDPTPESVLAGLDALRSLETPVGTVA